MHRLKGPPTVNLTSWPSTLLTNPPDHNKPLSTRTYLKRAENITEPEYSAITSRNARVFFDNDHNNLALAHSSQTTGHPKEEAHLLPCGENDQVNINYSTSDQVPCPPGQQDATSREIKNFINSADKPALCRALSLALHPYLYVNEPRSHEDCYKNLLKHDGDELIEITRELTTVHRLPWQQFHEKFLLDVPKAESIERSQPAIANLVQNNFDFGMHTKLTTNIDGNNDEDLYTPTPPPEFWRGI